MDNCCRIIVALDAMGGDFAPAEQVKGAVLAVNENNDIAVKLFGDEARVNFELSKYSFDRGKIEVIHCDDVIDITRSPVKAIKTGKESSMVKGLYAVKRNEADAFVSCGSTGALLVGGQVIIGRIKGIERPALSFIVPSLKGPVMIIDCGANVDARPEMLNQFAEMGSIYMESVLGIKNPRVGLINIGEEEEKGNSLTKETYPILKANKTINFIGNTESRQITQGYVDVAVCDAFVGNVILKMYEGVAGSLIKKLKETMMGSFKTKMGALMIKKDLKRMLKEFSIEEYGGAPFLGLNNLVVKPHGSSEAVEIKNSIIQCGAFVKADISGKIAEKINVEE